MDLTAADYLHTPAGTRQRDLTPRVEYDREYVQSRYAAIDEAVWLLAARRLAVLEAFVPTRGTLLDFGCGSGRGVLQAASRGWDAWGCDLADGPGRRLAAGVAAGRKWDVVCCFDSLEHVPDPAGLVGAFRPRHLLVSVPWCHYPERWDWFGPWKHRRPGEHLWHWGRESLDRLLGPAGYRPILHSSFEDEFRPNPAQAEPNVLTALFVRES